MLRKFKYKTADGITKTLEYTLVRSSRKTVAIHVNVDGTITARIPLLANSKRAEDILNDKLDWILKHKQRFEEIAKNTPTDRFTDGTKHLFLGKEHLLRVITSPEATNTVTKNNSYIDIECKEDTLAQSLLGQWYHEQAKKEFPEIINPVIKRFRETYNLEPSKISIKWMKSRWGSCSSKRNISLNSMLVMASPRCIELVIAHELCHMIHMNHSKDYYKLLTEFKPDWRESKMELKMLMLLNR